MDAIGYVALSRQLALQRHMTVIANNIANADTTGFLGEDLDFEAVSTRAQRNVRVAFVQDVTSRVDLSEGAMKPTGSVFDFAIAGDGFFAVQSPNGVRYTRSGHFRLDEQNQLVTFDGNPVLDVANQPIVLEANPNRIQVAVDGTMSLDGVEVARLQRARFQEPERLQREGSMLWQTEEAPGEADGAAVYQGMLEQSNVQPILMMTKLIEVSRAFEATQKLIETQHDLTRETVQRQLDVKS
jgi:flagellar basal-body rod protein FlgF